MSSLEEARRDFYSALEGLKDINAESGSKKDVVKAHARLEAQKNLIEEKRKILLAVDPEFKAMIEKRKHQARIGVDQMEVKYKAMMVDAEQARMKIEAARHEAERRTEIFVAEHRIKTRTLEEAKKSVNDKLICPICNDLDKGNVMNGIPSCFHDQEKYGSPHKLVSKSELKNYNRDYRRRWKRRH